MRQRRRRRERRAYDVSVKDPPPGVGVGFGQPNEGADGGGVDEVVDPPKRVGRRGERRSARRFIGNVAFDGDGPRPRFLGGGPRSLAPPGQKCDMIATPRKSNTNAAPQPARGSDHHGL
ncbi:hypothetical protein MPSD_35920 [Mycobacterium pseudoshottsii JCM 15466]|uniref:Uncharacterized protein n=1 Tax=Mycobacterium pseudoshottsii TaxID=265949 RepID=A0A9N7LTH3_9MYCO|nr:hypothetical protein MPSD_35920 [Mycobacterium pseudoshottsii JCM 15466]BDN83313.1 hypothetical protein NJB1907Z4_C35280 [Mycobacterium pseudoshottsii]